jgi:hypothetical protein
LKETNYQATNHQKRIFIENKINMGEFIPNYINEEKIMNIEGTVEIKNLKRQIRDERIKSILSTLWIAYFINHFFMGLHEMANPVFIDQLLSGFDVSDALLLFAAITIQPPIWMIVLSKVLPSKVNWIVGIVVAFYTIALELSNVYLNTNPPDLDNQFFFAAEMVSFIAIIAISIKWRMNQLKEKKTA